MPGILGRLLRRRALVIGAVIVAAFGAVAVGAPWIAPPADDDPYLIPKDGFQVVPAPPSREHPLGTMENQYDVLYGLVWGTRVAFEVGVSVTLGRALVGIVVGAVAGSAGGALDAVLMRVTDAFMAFPVLAATVVMLAVLGGGWSGPGARGIDRIIVLSLVLFGWMHYARLVRANVLAERGRDYVQAAVSVGVRRRRIILRHVLPNATRGLYVLAASDVGAMVVTVAALTFLGLSGVEVSADWGKMLKWSRNWIVGPPSNAFQYWYAYVPPSLAILFFSIGWNLIGDGLRDAFDPMIGRTR